MIRTFMTTTALAALLASGAIAQDAPATTEAPAMEAPATDNQPTTETEVVEDVEVVTEDSQQAAGSVTAEGNTAVDSDNLASNIIGAAVYSSEADDAEHIGDISDLVVDENGQITAAVIGVGGFLGIGEKLVAVDYSQLQWTVAADNTERFVLATTRENLEAAPEFQSQDDDPAAAGTGAAAPGTDPAAGTAPAAGADPAAGTAPAADPAADPAAGADAMAPAAGNDGAMAPGAEGGAMAPGAGTDGAMALDRSAMQEIDPTSLTAEDLEGTDVYGPNDEHIGSIGDLVLGDDDTVDAVIIDFGGFLGIGVKQVAVAYENLQFLGDEAGNRILVLNMTREQMEQAPEYNPDTYAQERDSQRVVVQ